MVLGWLREDAMRVREDATTSPLTIAFMPESCTCSKRKKKRIVSLIK